MQSDNWVRVGELLPKILAQMTPTDQARAIREQHEQKPQAPKETPREARWRVERERAQEEAKRNPHRGY